MSDFFQPELYQNEIFFDEIEAGQTFPPYRYSVTPAHMRAYGHAVGDDVTAGLSESDPRHQMLAALTALSYGFVYSAMQRRPPTGFINSTIGLSLDATVPVGQPLTMTVTVSDKEVRRDRKHVTLLAQVRDASGKPLVSNRIGCIFPN